MTRSDVSAGLGMPWLLAFPRACRRRCAAGPAWLRPVWACPGLARSGVEMGVYLGPALAAKAGKAAGTGRPPGTIASRIEAAACAAMPRSLLDFAQPPTPTPRKREDR